MSRLQTYYTVIFRENMHSKWGVHFGDFDHEVAKDEMESLFEHGYKRSQSKIIQTTAEQSDIDNVIDHLNAKG